MARFAPSPTVSEQLNKPDLTPAELHNLAWKVYDDPRSTEAERAFAARVIHQARVMQTPQPKIYQGWKGA